jgi:hypothetical protein
VELDEHIAANGSKTINNASDSAGRCSTGVRLVPVLLETAELVSGPKAFAEVLVFLWMISENEIFAAAAHARYVPLR